MGAPVEARTWNPFGGDVYGAPPATHNSGSNGPSTTYVGSSSATSGNNGTYFQGYSHPVTSSTTAWQPVLPEDMAAEARTLAGRAGNAPADDSYAQLIALSRLTQQVDGQLETMLQQPVDLTAAQGQVTTAQANHSQFLKHVYDSLPPEQRQQLYTLNTAVEQAKGPQQQQALVNFNQALDAVLTPEQRKTLLALERTVQDAQMNLQGQQLVKRILDARAGAAAPGPYGGPGSKGEQTLSLAMADGRAFVAMRMQIKADRKTQDAYTLLFTPQMRQQLAPAQQELLAATEVLQSNPNATWAQTRFNQAKADFDRIFGSLVNGQDREVLNNLQTYQSAMQNLAAVIGEEASTERGYFELLYPSNPPAAGSGPADPKVLEIARAGFNLAQHNRNMRSLALRATTDCNQDLHNQATEALVQSLRMTADLDVMRAQHNYDQALLQGPRGGQNNGGAAPNGMTLVSYSTGTAATGGVPGSEQTIATAKQLLDNAQQWRQEVHAALTPPPPPPKKSGWDYALDITMGALQTVGGVAIMWLAGWTGVGAVVGGAMAVDGAVRLGHSISDAANGTVTDAPISAGLQKLGMSRRWANTADTGVGLIVTVPAGGYGAYAGLVKGGMALKTASGVGLLTMTDSTVAAGRYMVTGEAAHPFAVEGLTAVGLTPTQANYAVFGGNLLLAGGAVKGLRPGNATAAPTTAAAASTSKKTTTLATTTSTSNKVITITGLRAPGAPATVTTNTGATSIPVVATGTHVGTTGGAPRAPALVTSSGASSTGTLTGTRPLITVRIGNTLAPLDETSWQARHPPRWSENEQQRVYADGRPRSNSTNIASTTGLQTRSSPLFLPSSAGLPDVTILGNGHVAITLAADIRMSSSLTPEVLMRPKGADRIGPYTGEYLFREVLHKTWHETELGRQHFGYLGTDEAVAAMRNSNTVVITIPDQPRVRLQLFEFLQQQGLVNDPSKTFVLIRGGQAGQPALSQMIRNNPDWRANVVLVEDSPYGTRVARGPSNGFLVNEEGLPILGPDGEPIVLGPNKHYVQAKRKEEVEISVLGEHGNRAPGTLATQDLFPRGAEIGKPSWPDFTVVDGVAMPWRFGHAIHPGVAFHPVNLARTARGEVYLHYVQGVTREIGEQLAILDQEKMQLAATYGAPPESFPMKLHRQFGLELIPDESFYDTMQRTIEQAHIPYSKKIYTSKSYPSIEDLMNSRYPQEDVPGVFTMNWYAERAGLYLPGHVQFEAALRSTLNQLSLDLGRSPEALTYQIDGYLPILNEIPGGVQEIAQLLNTPHIRRSA
ncbi:NAD/NADP octopine/nopaline dehydrogenase family protein [Peristeroidobacter agariperforans]|uniref:NAD/NADP octopine/nopaline dehydrogenase family protein n=1 Tax=Peristeroidobacter agariperforans TaxID=268404 RepID=UPI00101E09DA|nr:NAD/NADP octopine/nopaline dehydrogenase family protein [Peristeroidobacter agariperforans]